MKEFMTLERRVAVVTGAARGIGYAIAERFGRAGATVVLADIDEAELHVANERLQGLGLAVDPVVIDVRKRSDVDELVDSVVERYGRLDSFVNNAGIVGRVGPLVEQQDADWHEVIATDLTSVFLCSRAAVRVMEATGGGTIISIASITGKEGNPNQIPYSVAKAGVIALTKALAKEVACRNIRVNCVAPAVTATRMAESLPATTLAALIARSPLGRLARADEVAAVVHFLASDESTFVTGQCYDVSGGRATY